METDSTSMRLFFARAKKVVIEFRLKCRYTEELLLTTTISFNGESI